MTVYRALTVLCGVVALLALSWLALRDGGALDSGPKSSRPASIVSAIADGAREGFTRVQGPQSLEFPRDHGPHPDHQLEWWYFTGNLEGDDGAEYGFQLTFFRTALRAEAPRTGLGLGLPGELHGPLRPRRGAQRPLPRLRPLRARRPGSRRSPRRALPGVGRGLVGRSRELGHPARCACAPPRARSPSICGSIPASRSCSRAIAASAAREPSRATPRCTSRSPACPRAAACASATARLRCAGQAWMDHEWSTSVLGPELAGWDWFALQLADGRDLMLYHLRRKDGTSGPFSAGVIVDADGCGAEARPRGVHDHRPRSLAEPRDRQPATPHAGASRSPPGASTSRSSPRSPTRSSASPSPTGKARSRRAIPTVGPPARASWSWSATRRPPASPASCLRSSLSSVRSREHGAPRSSRPTRRGPRVGHPASEPRCAHGDHVRSAERISALQTSWAICAGRIRASPHFSPDRVGGAIAASNPCLEARSGRGHRRGFENNPFEDRCVQGARRPSAVAHGVAALELRAISEGGGGLGGTRPNGRPDLLRNPGPAYAVRSARSGAGNMERRDPLGRPDAVPALGIPPRSPDALMGTMCARPRESRRSKPAGPSAQAGSGLVSCPRSSQHWTPERAAATRSQRR